MFDARLAASLLRHQALLCPSESRTARGDEPEGQYCMPGAFSSYDWHKKTPVSPAINVTRHHCTQRQQYGNKSLFVCCPSFIIGWEVATATMPRNTPHLHPTPPLPTPPLPSPPLSPSLLSRQHKHCCAFRVEVSKSSLKLPMPTVFASTTETSAVGQPSPFKSSPSMGRCDCGIL